MITAVILSWKRPQNIPKIVSHLLSKDYIRSIIVHNNLSGKNIINFGRYVYRGDIIYTQDDDCIVHNIDVIWEAFKKDSAAIHLGATNSYIGKESEIYNDKEVSLLGWGAFFKKEWTSVFKKYEKVHGKDYIYYRESDRIFTMLSGRKQIRHNGKIEHLNGYINKGVALSEQREHIETKNLAIQRCLHL